MTDSQDAVYMARAIRLARRGLYTAHPNPRVGCVIAKDGKTLGEGWHARTGEPHAEVVALNAAGKSAREADAYVSLEPCSHEGRTPPCAQALIRAGIARVVYACPDPNPRVSGAGAKALAAAGIEVVSGCLEQVASDLNAGFINRMRRAKPRVVSKIAASIDGRTALADGSSKWITGPAARADVQRLRAMSGAILTGTGTVLADDPSLNVRDDSLGDVLQPLRAIVDSELRTPPGSRLFRTGGEVHVFATRGTSRRSAALESAGATVHRLSSGDSRPDLAQVLGVLATLEINDVLVEAGPGVNGALLEAGLIDECIVYLAPHALGDTARGMFALGNLRSMGERPSFRLAEQRAVGDDLRLRYTTERPEVGD